MIFILYALHPSADFLPAPVTDDRLATMSAKKKGASKRTKTKPSTRKKMASATKKPARKKPSVRKQAPHKKTVANRKRSSSRTAFSRQKPGVHSGAEAGSVDLQGLSRREDVDSESVEELVEEGNAFEAGVVVGVEEADDAEEKEVRTREFPEDDVPGEYLDKD